VWARASLGEGRGGGKCGSGKCRSGNCRGRYGRMDKKPE